MPFQGTLGAVDFNPQVIFAPMRNLRRRDRAQCAIFVLNGGTAVIVQLAPWLKDLEQTRNLVWLQTRDEPAQVVRMGADVAKAPGRAGALRVGTPAGLLLVVFLQPLAQPALNVKGTN